MQNDFLCFNLDSPFHFSFKKKGRGAGGWVSHVLRFLNTIGCVYPLKYAMRHINIASHI